MTPATYHPTHSRTLPPPDQGNEKFLLIVSVRGFSWHLHSFYLHGDKGVLLSMVFVYEELTCAKLFSAVITTEARNILLRHIYKRAEEQVMRPMPSYLSLHCCTRCAQTPENFLSFWYSSNSYGISPCSWDLRELRLNILYPSMDASNRGHLPTELFSFSM